MSKTFRPLPQHFSIQPVMDVAYSLRLGAEVKLLVFIHVKLIPTLKKG